MSSQRPSVLFCYLSLMMVEIYEKNLRNFNDGCFCAVMRSQWWSSLFLCTFTRFQRRSVFSQYEISKTVSFVLLRDFNIGRFCSVIRSQWRQFFFSFVPLQDFKDCRLGNEISKTVVLFRYEISMMVGFVRLWDLSDGRFCSFVPLGVFKDGRFCFVTRV